MQIREIKHHLNGSQQVFFCDLLYRGEGAMIVRFQTTEDPYAAVARTTEGYFWEGRNYLIYKMFNQFGDLVGHRADVCRDVRFGPDSVDWTDLLLDFFITPQGELRVLDQDEVKEAVARGALSPEDMAILARIRELFEGQHEALIAEAADLRARVQPAGRRAS